MKSLLRNPGDEVVRWPLFSFCPLCTTTNKIKESVYIWFLNILCRHEFCKNVEKDTVLVRHWTKLITWVSFQMWFSLQWRQGTLLHGHSPVTWQSRSRLINFSSQFSFVHSTILNRHVISWLYFAIKTSGFATISFPEPANFLERTGSDSPQIADLLYCITFQITNQDHLRIGPFQCLRFHRACTVRS